MVKLWRCEICGDPYIGESAPDNCPFCGAHKKYIKEAKEAKVNFDVELNESDKENVKRALQVEISNAAFYFCAAKNKIIAEVGPLLVSDALRGHLAAFVVGAGVIMLAMLAAPQIPPAFGACVPAAHLANQVEFRPAKGTVHE